jgi:hypothetical protein
MGRNRKTRAEHERNGTFEKHPERKAAYANEPKPDGPLGPPPATWKKHARADEAAVMFAEGKSTNEVAAALEIDWDTARTIRVSPALQHERAELLAIWHEIVDQAPSGVLTSSDRLHVEMTCRLIYKIRVGTALAGDYSRVREFLGKMAMNPADRPKVQVGVSVAPAAQGADASNQNANPFAQLKAEEAGRARPN